MRRVRFIETILVTTMVVACASTFVTYVKGAVTAPLSQVATALVAKR